MSQPIILVEGLKKYFGKVKAVDGVDLAVERGTVLGLLGPNGAGKTTIVRVLTTLITPDAGHLEVAGYDVVHQARALRASIGLAGQQVALDDHLTGKESLLMVASLYHMGRKTAHKRASEFLERFDLLWAGDRTIKTYSGGMRRRLDLAVSLIGFPEVLFLDEPTTGLDPQSRIDLWEVIRGLVAEGTTLLLTTQYLEEADHLADAIAVVDSGHVIAYGTSDELKSKIGNDVLEVSLNTDQDVSTTVGALEVFSASEPQVDKVSHKVGIAITDSKTILVNAVRALDDAGISVADIAVHKPTLDDVFLTLTGHGAEVKPSTAPTSSTLPTVSTTSAEPVSTMGPITSPPIAKEAVSPSPTNSPTTSLASASHEKHLEPGFKQLLSWSITDFVAIAKRNLLRYVRLPNLLVMSVVQPIMFVLLFNYVFGGVLKLTIQGSYIDYLMPGIFAQAVIFGSVQTGIGLAQDLSTGMFDRFRSLPMARSAVLVGRTLADTGRNVFVILLMAGVGAIIGFRFEAGITAAIAAMALVLMFGLSFSWLSAVIGLITKDVEAAQAASIIWIMPLTFASSAFVPVATMPGWLQAFAKADPVSHTANALRSLFMGGPVATQLWETIVWLVGILLVTVPLAVFLYRKAS